MVREIHRRLLRHFGYLGWWSSSRGFRPPELEICIGAILTQNTSWGNVEKALDSLTRAGLLTREEMLNTPKKKLESLIRPSGFFRQKAERLLGFLEFSEGFGGFRAFLRKVSREELLGVKGIGPETADSILLYGGNRPFFVVDLYTRRLFQRLGLGKLDYRQAQEMVARGFPKSVKAYKEFHALIVEHSKKFCRARPVCSGCPLKKRCREVKPGT